MTVFKDRAYISVNVLNVEYVNCQLQFFWREYGDNNFTTGMSHPNLQDKLNAWSNMFLVNYSYDLNFASENARVRERRRYLFSLAVKMENKTYIWSKQISSVCDTRIRK
jgi:hypothetical protein